MPRTRKRILMPSSPEHIVDEPIDNAMDADIETSGAWGQILMLREILILLDMYMSSL